MNATMNNNEHVQHLEIVGNLVNNVRMLRLSVTELFSTLADNGPEQQQGSFYQHHQQNNNSANSVHLDLEEHLMLIGSNHHINCRTLSPHLRLLRQQDKQSQQDLIQYVSGSINKIYTILRTLDEGVDHLTGPALNLSLAESAHLGYDLVSERNNLYIDLCKTFKTYDNLHEYASHCHTLLNQQSLKRSYLLATTPRVDRSQKRALFNPYNRMQLSRMPNGQTAMISDLISSCIKSLHTMEAVYSRPFGASTGVVQLSLNKILKAVLLLRGKVLDAMIIKAYHESFAVEGAHKYATKSGSKQQQQQNFVDPDSEVDIWSESKYLVFRKITKQANTAMLHFQFPQFPEVALKTFLAWLNSYSNLFSATCTKCNSRLRNFLPPTCREYRTGFDAHHESCR